MGAAYLKGPEQPRPQGKNACMRKADHTTKKRAIAAAGTRLRDPGCRERELWVYRCPCCASWHMTSHPRAGCVLVRGRDKIGPNNPE